MFTDFVSIRCWKCDVEYGMNRRVYDQRNKDKGGFFCTNGHEAAFNESTADKLRRERDRLQQQLAEKDDEIARQRSLRETTERQLSATKGVVTRIKNRVGHGVCPCCTRTFENLARHMATKHADYAQQAAE